MTIYAIRIDRNAISVILYALAVYSLMGLSEILMRSHDGITTSLALYLPILLGTVWAAPSLSREIESGTLAWAWTKGVSRRRWLMTRIIPIFAGAVMSGLFLSIVILVTQSRWWPSMSQDRITPALIAASPPVLITFCLLAVSMGVFFAVATGKLISSIGFTFLSVAMMSYVVPSLAVQWAPTRKTTAPVSLGHVTNQQFLNGVTTTTYIPNSFFWPISLAVVFVLLLLAVASLLETVRRIQGLSL